MVEPGNTQRSVFSSMVDFNRWRIAVLGYWFPRRTAGSFRQLRSASASAAYLVRTVQIRPVFPFALAAWGHGCSLASL